MNKTARFWLTAIVVLLTAPVIAHAQLSGCVDSPENPTAVLMVVGGAAYAWPTIRQKLRGLRGK
jgi:XrtJ-associated TM-motif-TM protein